MNGYRNWETWNVATWIQNDETLYTIARNCAKVSRKTPYSEFVDAMTGLNITRTPDGASLESENIDVTAINHVMRDLY